MATVKRVGIMELPLLVLDKSNQDALLFLEWLSDYPNKVTVFDDKENSQLQINITNKVFSVHQLACNYINDNQ